MSPSDRPARAWDSAAAGNAPEHRPRLRLVLGPIHDIQYEEGGVGDSALGFVYPELRLSYPFDEPDSTGGTEVTIASASCVLITWFNSDALCEIDDDLAHLTTTFEEAGWDSYSLLHVSDVVVDPYWRGGGLGPAFLSLIAHECDAPAVTLEPAPIRTVRRGTELDSRYYVGASTRDRAAVADAWGRAGFVGVHVGPGSERDDEPVTRDEHEEGLEPWEDEGRERSRWVVRMEDDTTHVAARRLHAAARGAARQSAAREWHRQRVRAAMRSAARSARAAARRDALTVPDASDPQPPRDAADAAKSADSDAQKARDDAEELIRRRISRILPTSGPWLGADTILLPEGHLQVRTSGKGPPTLKIELIADPTGRTGSSGPGGAADVPPADDPVATALRAVDDVVVVGGRGIRSWKVIHRVRESCSSSAFEAAGAIVCALVEGLGLLPKDVLDAATNSAMSPDPWSAHRYRPRVDERGTVEDVEDLELDYTDFVMTTRASREHFTPWAADVPPQFFVIGRGRPDAPSTATEPDVLPSGELVALAARGGGSVQPTWYRHDLDGWIPDPSVPRLLLAAPGLRLVPIGKKQARGLEAEQSGVQD